jgi:hypothetical protein
MIGTPWWGAALIGVLTVIGAGFAAWIGANRTTEATRQREHAAAREEWFRRMQWAGQMALSEDERTRLAGLALLEVLATSPLAGSAELDMLAALNDNAALDRYTEAVDAATELGDDGEDEEGQI